MTDNYTLDEYESEFCASWIDESEIETDALGRCFSDADNGL